jgi:hypothetical protein
MKRYFQCRFRHVKPTTKKEEFVNDTPVEILSPLNQFERPLPEEKEKLDVFNFELVEQMHLLEAEYNKYFQEAKYSIEKNDMTKAVHYMNRGREIKKRIMSLERRHSDVMKKLEAMLLKNPSYKIYMSPNLKSLPTLL